MTETSRALEIPQARWEPEGSVRWLRSNWILAVGLVLIGLQLWWKAGFLGRSFFRLDDYYYLERASTTGLSWSYLTWVNDGHLNVVGAVIAWLTAQSSPDDWPLATLVTLLLLGATCLALLRMLRTLFGDRPWVLLLVVLYMLDPLSLPGLSWWTVALEQLPMQLAIFCAVDAHVRYLRTKRYGHAIAAAAWMAVAMLSDFQGAATPLLLFVLTSAFFTQGTWSRALWPTLREHWRAWALYVALAAGYLAFYVNRLQASPAPSGPPAAVANDLTYAGTLLRKTFLPGAFGGPWRWVGTGVQALTSPPTALIWASEALGLVVMLASLMFTWRAWRAWVILAGWIVVVDIVSVAAGQSSLIAGAVQGLAARYAWDATGILVLCLGLAFLPLADGTAPRRPPRRLSRPEFAAATTLIVAIVVGSLWSFYDYPSDPTAASASSYIATARLALDQAPAGTVIVDDPTPANVTDGFFGPVTNASSVLSPLLAGLPGTKPLFVTLPDGTIDHLMEFNGLGQLVPAGIVGAVSPARPTGPACWNMGSDIAVIPLSSTATSASTLRIGYLSGVLGQVLVTYGGRSQALTIEKGLHSAYLPVQGSSGAVIVQPLSGAMPCVGDAQAGVLLPSSAGPSIPPRAVSG
ncbi:MAG: hypothetical protein JWM19_6664 [Actinomycetia bacterium]|nr:hypothetical protein [Actinomycetes bacterium]